MNSRGFTIIELMIAVVVLAILSGITVSVINVPQKQKQAQDTVIRNKLHDLSQLAEAYWYLEGVYPATGQALVGASYAQEWPTTGFNYKLAGDGKSFSIQVTKMSDTGFFKYSSPWGEIRDCAAGTNPNDVNDCK